MQKPSDPDVYELREEYDLPQLPIVAQAGYSPDRRAGKNVVLLAPDVEGSTEANLLDAYPGLTRQDIQAALSFGRQDPS